MLGKRRPKVFFCVYTPHSDNKQNIVALCNAKNEIDQDFYSLFVLIIGKKISLLENKWSLSMSDKDCKNNFMESAFSG